MSTHAFASATVPAPVDQVWAALRDFTFPQKLGLGNVASSEIEEGAGSTTVGAVRKTTWKNGAVVRHRLLEVSDVRRSLVWEVLPSGNDEAVSVVAAAETKVQLYRVTENNSTFITWSTDFSSDVEGKHVVEAQQDYAENLKEIKAFFSKK